MSEHPIETGITGVVRIYELLDRVRTRQDLVIRDDQFDFAVLLEASRYADRRGIRLSLLDTGRLGLDQVESLARAGARILTSDEARPRPDEWGILQKACRRGGTHLSLFWSGPLPAADAAEGIATAGLETVLEAGVDFHISDRTRPRDAATLATLAAAAKKGRAFFVVYHAGLPTDELVPLASGGAWIHLADEGLVDAGPGAKAVEIAAAASAGGARAVVHIERGLPLEVLEELWAAGAALLFLTAPSDDRSLLRPIERKAGRRRLPLRAYRLSTAFLP